MGLIVLEEQEIEIETDFNMEKCYEHFIFTADIYCDVTHTEYNILDVENIEIHDVYDIKIFSSVLGEFLSIDFKRDSNNLKKKLIDNILKQKIEEIKDIILYKTAYPAHCYHRTYEHM